jgi:glycosyltransferase involved in cell wall biosynthesis
MRLFHVNAGYWPLVGGAETYVQAISERLAQTGARVTVLTSDAAELETLWNARGARVAARSEILSGVQIMRAPVQHLLLSPYPFHGFRRISGYLYGQNWANPLLRLMGGFMPWLPALPKLLDQTPRPDLVHAINISLEGAIWPAFAWARRERRPFVLTPFVHIGHWAAVERYYTLPHHLALMRASAAVLAQTEPERQRLIELGVPPQRLHVLGMGVDVAAATGGIAERFRARHQVMGPLITFMGAITLDKGAIHLLEAMRRLWACFPEARLALAGKAIPEGGFERALAQCSPDEQAKVLRLGQVLDDDKRDLLAATTVLAMPSRVDAFGIVFLEAWANGAPVIGANAGGIPGVISHERTGLLVPFGEPAALSAALMRLLAQPAWAQALGAAGRAKVYAGHTWDHITARLQAIYAEVLTAQ